MNNNNNSNSNNSNIASGGGGDVVCWNPHTSTRFNVISNRDVHHYKINEEILNRVIENGFDDSIEIAHCKQEGMILLFSDTFPDNQKN